MKILEITNLVKNYGSLRAVDHVSFDIKKGETFGLLGPNGAGKTTLISTVTTLEKMDEGQIKVCGIDVTKKPSVTKSLMGFMPQDNIIHGYFTVREVVTFCCGFSGVWPDRDRVDYFLKKLVLWDKRDQKVRYLSGGMQRRLLLAKALVHSPRLLLLDEPTAGVDVQLRSKIWDLIRELKKETSILFTTHYLEEAEKLCDRVAFIHQGQIKKVGQIQDLISHLTHRKILIKFQQSKSIENKYHLGQNEGYNLFLVPSSLNLGTLFKQLDVGKDDIEDLKIQEGSLQEVFNKVIGEQNAAG